MALTILEGRSIKGKPSKKEPFARLEEVEDPIRISCVVIFSSSRSLAWPRRSHPQQKFKWLSCLRELPV